MGGWAIYAIVLIIVAVAVFLFARRAAPGKVSDAQVIEQLTKGGSNLTRPHNIELRFYFPSRELAERVTGTLRAEASKYRLKKLPKAINILSELPAQWFLSCPSCNHSAPDLMNSPRGKAGFMTAGAQGWSSKTAR